MADFELTPGVITLDEVKTASDECVDMCVGKYVALTALFYDGDMSPEEFEEEAISLLKSSYIQQYTLGIGGESQMTEGELAVVAALIATQIPFLSNMIQSVVNGTYGSKAQAMNWSSGYMLSSQQAFEKANTYAVQRTSDFFIRQDLPAYPGDGSTICRSYCRCHWSHVFGGPTGGFWLGSRWVLRELAKHCPTCEARAINWNPLILYEYREVNGVIQPFYVGP